jgi:hypothetical protein
MRNLVHLAVAGSLMVACGVSHERAGSGGSSSGDPIGDGDSPGSASDGGMPSPPRSVEDLVALANSLPRPATLAAFIAALPHPLALSATSSQLSLQPAVDSDDPRIFVIVGSLALSVVPTGPQVNDLEIGDMSNGKMSPASISFPITSPVAPADPYQAVLDATGTHTVCAKCHKKNGAEVQISQVSGTPVFAEGQRLPLEPFNVPVTTLISLAQDCDPSSNPERCDIFDALIQPGMPSQYDF